MRLLNSIGRTPLVRLERLTQGMDCEILVKIEARNPGGSIKDRPALNMIETALRQGVLSPEGTLVEPTSGNMGIGLALVAACMGLKLVLTMPESMSDERKALLLSAKYFKELKLEGGLLRVGGQVVAFTMGDLLGVDTFDVHFEKAYSEIQGAYPMINREFARRIRQRYPQVRYLNREEDMGIEGLRKAKESYYPDLMVEKHWVVRKK